ncbi:hypothetical protein EDB85DRAFT_1888865 [Lactarius pseudohatsudake]|nr:hypothetical protein EDB85DRAFT_1888865 [Lactarius pseudohatsudake]
MSVDSGRTCKCQQDKPPAGTAELAALCPSHEPEKNWDRTGPQPVATGPSVAVRLAWELYRLRFIRIWHVAEPPWDRLGPVSTGYRQLEHYDHDDQHCRRRPQPHRRRPQQQQRQPQPFHDDGYDDYGDYGDYSGQLRRLRRATTATSRRRPMAAHVTVSLSPARDSPRDYTPTADIPFAESANTPEDPWWDWQAKEDPRVQDRIWAAIEALEDTTRTGRLCALGVCPATVHFTSICHYQHLSNAPTPCNAVAAANGHTRLKSSPTSRKERYSSPIDRYGHHSHDGYDDDDGDDHGDYGDDDDD